MWREELLEVASRSALGWSLATADWDRSVYCDHLCEDVEYGLGHVSIIVDKEGERRAYLWDRLVVDVDQLSRVGVDLQCAVKA
jgi:hypothetical protein